MQSFIQHIAEKRIELISARKGVGTTKGLENPSMSELMGFAQRSTYKEARFLIHKKTGRFLVWDATAPSLHWDIINGEEGTPMAMLDNLYYEGALRMQVVAGNNLWVIQFHAPNESDAKKALKNNRALKQMVARTKFITVKYAGGSETIPNEKF